MKQVAFGGPYLIVGLQRKFRVVVEVKKAKQRIAVALMCNAAGNLEIIEAKVLEGN